MKPGKFQKKWIKALKSKRYKKGTDYLSRNGSFCVLGVAKEALPELNLKSKDNMCISNYKSLGLYDPYGKDKTGENTLVNLNDDTDLTLPQIGAILERYPDKYFKESV